MPHFEEDTNHDRLMLSMLRRILALKEAEMAKENEADRDWAPMLRLLREALVRADEWTDLSLEARMGLFQWAGSMLGDIGLEEESRAAFSRFRELVAEMELEEDAASQEAAAQEEGS